MRRRDFFASLGGVALSPFTAHAQRLDGKHRIGVLGNTPESADELRQAVRGFGWIEGQNITFEWRWAAGRLDRLPELAAELVRLRVDVIITMTHRVALAAKEATTTIPIVFTRVNDPVGVGLVESLARSGSNLTGISLQGLDLIGVRLQLLQEAATQLVRVAYLTDPTEPYSPRYLAEVKTSAKKMGIKDVLALEASSTEDFSKLFSELMRQPIDGLVVEPNSLNLANRDRLSDFLLEQRLPSIHGERRFMGAKGLMSYGPNISDHFKDAAIYVDKILRGIKPSEIPVEQPTKFELVINLRTVKAFGLTLRPSLLARADEIIE